MTPALLFSVLALLPGTDAARAPAAKAKALLSHDVKQGQPDTDHLVKELHDNADYKNPSQKPMTSLTKDFATMDYNGDGHLDAPELMFHQFATGCEPMEGQVRAEDYMKCGDLDKNKLISAQEFNASTQPAFAECVKESAVRRSHGFVKFFPSDQDMDGKLSRKELEVGVITLWGQPGEALADDYMKCVDKNKDGFIDQKEFHSSIAAYNPATRKWTMWNGTSDKEIIKCMEPAYAKFDAALVFHAVDTNHDQRISEQEEYNLFSHLGSSGTMLSTTADQIFWAADKDKDGFLNLEEFEKAGEAYKGKNEAVEKPAASFFLSARSKWPIDTYNEGYGMSVRCSNSYRGEWRVFSEDLGRVKVVPKLCPDSAPGKAPKYCWDGSVKVEQR